MINKLRKILTSSTSRDALVSFVGLATIAAVGMLFSIVTARAFGPEGLGVFAALNAIVTLSAGIGDFGISAALVNFLPKIKNDRHLLISVTFWFQLIVAIILCLILMTLTLVHTHIIPGSEEVHFVIVGFLTAIYVFQGFALGIFNADKKFLQGSILQGSDSVLKLLFVMALIFANRLTIELALIANIISCSISVLYGLRSELSNIRTIFPREQLSPIISFSKWIALTRFFSVMVSRIDIILLNLLASSYAAGLFAAASRISLFFALLVSSLGSVTAPRFSSFTSKDEIKQYLNKVFLLVGGISIIMALSSFFAKPLVWFVFGDKFMASVPVFQAMTFAMIPFLISIATTNPIVYSFNQPHFLAKVTIVQVTTLIVLDILLIPVYAEIAPAISLGITNILVLTLSGIKLRKLLS